MYRFSLLLAVLALCPMLPAESSRKSTTPAYTSASVVNSATNTTDALAPNTIATIYGTDLSYSTDQASSANIVDHMLPQVLAGVRLFVGGYPAGLYFVSPRQVNFVIPELRAGGWDVYVAREGTAGPHVRVTVRDVGPGLYQWEPGLIASTHADGNNITKDHPAHAGETVVLYGTGLGDTEPPEIVGQVNMVAAQMQRLNDLRVVVGGKTLDSASTEYAGVTPGSPGLYQINVRLPKQVATNPEIRLTIGDQSSPANTKLPVR
jgi:uncharacterized protein (TIGR03437 family)